ncbi:MAG: DUF1501 domain-containing protein [Planctomycetaceae bacterium]|nr:DUF1501 domain-containing protein [Planctomycetaceae bacterium]
MASRTSRRNFLKSSLASSAALLAPGLAPTLKAAPVRPAAKLIPRADSVIFIWLPGGIAQADTWDPKRHTPFVAGMKGSELLGTCPTIPTAVDGLEFGAGLENLASVMQHGTVLRSLASETKFGAVHLKAQYAMLTGHLFPVGLKAPSLGAAVGRTLGPRAEHVPPYIYIGRDIDTSDPEKQFISEAIGSGFYGVEHAPFMIPDPTQGLATLSALAEIGVERLDRQLQYLHTLEGLSTPNLRKSPTAQRYLQMVDSARAIMDSPIKRAFDYAREERPEVLAAYTPDITAGDLLDKSYFFGKRFGHGLLLARRLVESGARFVQVEYQYGPFRGFDMHEDGQARMVEMKKQIDAPIAQLIRDLAERDLLARTLVVIATEFGRTIANQPKAGVEPIGFAESQSGEQLILEDRKMYGFHGHFSSANCMLFFGGGFQPGLVYGRTADRHPMVAVENPVALTDVHATIYKALGIPADTHYVTEGRPFYVTKDGKGKAIDALLA